MTALPLRALRQNDDNPSDNHQNGGDIVSIVTDIQFRLHAIENTINSLTRAGDQATIAALIHRLAKEDKDTLTQYIKHIRKYDKEAMLREKQLELESQTTEHNLDTSTNQDAIQELYSLENTLHDLRNGLFGLVGYIHLIEKGKLAGREKLIYSGIKKTAKYIDDIIDDWLIHKNMVYKQVNLAKIIQHAVRVSRTPNVKPVVQVENLSIKGDKLQLLRVFANLLENAYQALNNKKGIIIIQSFTEDNNITILISDNGIGIKKTLQPKIFNKHFTTKPTGKGIGLTICKSIIEEHGGSIRAESDENQGSTFIIQLPLTN